MGKCPRYIIKRKIEINKQQPVKGIIEEPTGTIKRQNTYVLTCTRNVHCFCRQKEQKKW